MAPRKIIFDTDPGIDDAMALLFAHHHPDIDLVGITTVLGNASVDRTTHNALYICDKFAIDAPVHRGAASALEVPDEDVPAFVHGDDGLGNVNPGSVALEPGDLAAADFIVEQVLAAPGEISIVAVGRLTNLALALAREPRIAEATAEVIVMGGALGSNEFTGNVTPVAEANIYGDPHAADMVFTAGWPVVLVGLDVTMTCVMERPQMQRIRAQSGQSGEFLWDITRFYENYYRERRGVLGFPVHDSCAIVYAVAPEMFDTMSGALRVITEGISRGQTILVPADRQFPPSGWDDVPHTEGCLQIDSEGVLSLYEDILRRGAR